jgi:hypothetical protein
MEGYVVINDEETYIEKTSNFIDDSLVTDCYKCKSVFTFFNRRHHCRLCGKIFCNDCSDKRINNFNTHIHNNGFMGYLFNYDQSTLRVCNNCYFKNQEVKEISNLFKIFTLVDLDLHDIKTCMLVCKKWQKAGKLYIEQLEKIYNNYPTDQLKKFQKNILINNIHLISNHSKYIYQLIKHIPIEYLNDVFTRKNKKITCEEVYCDRKICSGYLLTEDLLNLIQKSVRHNKVQKYIMDCIKIISDEELLHYIFNFAYYIDNFNDLEEELIIRSIKNIDICMEYYNSLILFHNTTAIQNLIGKLDKEKSKIIKTYHKIKNQIPLLAKGGDLDIIMNPINISKKYINIEKNKIEIKNSNTKPIIIPYITSEHTCDKIMYKNEDMKRDKIISNIIHIFDRLLKQEEGEYYIQKYKVLPLDRDSGIVEIVDNSVTLSELKKKLNFSILNYIIDKNPTKTGKEIRERFTKSSAAYCILTYILGIGDRHLDNIMVSNEGILFHIDYSYILSNNPTANNHKEIRITNDIIDALGGKSSDNYKEFHKQCIVIYNCARRHINLFHNMFSILTEFYSGFTIDYIRNEIIKKFDKESCDKDASLHIVTKINSSKDSYDQYLRDMCHEGSKMVSKSIGKNLISRYILGFSR